MATGFGSETWEEPDACVRPKERASAAWAGPGTTRELTDGVLQRDVPLKAEGTGLLLPLLLPPVCLFSTPAAAMAAWTWEGLGLTPEQLGIIKLDDPGETDGSPEGV